jgi:hypothetical protein
MSAKKLKDSLKNTAKAMKLRVAEVSYEGRIDEYDVVADDNLKAHDLVVQYLEGTAPKWKKIKVRDTLNKMIGPARVIGKRG